ncbi:hypothetical protein B0F90DRAFT_1817192 [Multifurca ochricompacta]|uniref:T6SS Phospholipase effector Tle1-like catalytic domain-containing protein n=1 Tax=Multifurca ochricompacta TaxID=376703 RepID=A0AAD4M469_9AGAM|nr:hypothetical protein B0F90DRAFT_1817192 [Multifurca ochricompacta]
MVNPQYYSPSDVTYQKPRTLVLCFDGTANEFNDSNTNVVKLYSVLKKNSPESQLCYYQESAGIGTYFQPGVVAPFFRTVARVLDEAFAWYLSEHIRDGYQFLMQNYHEGDSVCLFGFSRGAYTARALAGMLHKVGLLSKDNLEQIPFAYKLYKDTRPQVNKLAYRFKKSFCREVPIEFLGVWDTVASVGILKPTTLPFVGTNDMIRVFRQALSLDECRAKFSPNTHHRPIIPQRLGPRPSLKTIVRALTVFKIRRTRDTPNAPLGPRVYTSLGKHEVVKVDVKEVWFAGSHSDVGGGLAKDTEEHALSNISLRWMIREIVKARCHIQFDEAVLEEWRVPTTTILGEDLTRKMTRDDHATLTEGEMSTSSTLGKNAPAPSPSMFTEQSLDAFDAVQKMGNALRDTPFWWIVELIPTYHEWQNERDEWIGKWRFHFGRGREVPPRPLFHESVRIRMNSPVLNYTPKAQYEKGTEEYVM